MRNYTSASITGAKQAQPLGSLEQFLGCAGGEGPGLIASDATLGGGALSGLSADCGAADQPVDVLCVCGTALSKDRLSLSPGPSGLVGRVLESGHTAGEPTETHVRQVFMGADNAPRVANLACCGDAATEGDAAAGKGRGVARVAG
jgi:hypothetical protein